MITTDEKILRTPCTDATPDEVDGIIETLEAELKHSERMGRPGIGLASPQIGISKNIAIVRIDDLYKVNLVNCKIKNKYDQFLFQQEGCLSYPGLIEDTMRYNEIHIIDNLVYPHSFIAKGLFAIAIQHELDHLNNILLPDIAIKKRKEKIRPNDPCGCGSKKKAKHCCNKKEIK